jgi:hypothetical protein
LAGSKKYADVDHYETKLAKVMERFGAHEWNYNWDRHGGWVEMRLDGELYRFDHSVEKAKANGQDIRYGSDAFAQLVLALEDLARIAERGIYSIKRWIEGMRYLPPPVIVPECFRLMGFESVPDAAELTDRYRSLAKQRHPDAKGGSTVKFKQLQQAMEDAKRFLEEGRT